MNSKMIVLTLLLPLALSACGGSESASTEAKPGSAAESGKHEEGEAGHKEGEGEHKEGEGEHDEGGLALTPEQIKAAGIELTQAGPAMIRETLPLYGVVAPNAERVREVTARYPGVIRSVSTTIGSNVRPGQSLASVESNESLQTYAVTAPLAGVVTARNANPGEQTGDKALFTVADLSTVWVELSLFPRDIAKVRVGQEVRVKNADANRSVTGKLVYVAPFGSSSNQTLTARVLLDNADGRWSPGLYVTADVILAESPANLAIRNEAVQNLEGRNVVFVAEGKGFEARPVKLGRSDGETSEVLEGIRAGETYATHNSFILKAELGKGEAEHGH